MLHVKNMEHIVNLMRVNSLPLGATKEKKKLNTPLPAAGFFLLKSLLYNIIFGFEIICLAYMI